MVVRLDKVPPPAVRPKLPRLWRWVALLVPCLIAGVGATLWLGGDALGQRPVRFWLFALGLPTLVWGGLVTIRALAYLGDEAVADGWDRARDAELTQKMRQGRRSQQVLAVGLRTALHGSGKEDGRAQLQALRLGESALREQTSWQEQSARHSRIVRDTSLPVEEELVRQLSAVLEEIALVLHKLPEDRPLALLVEKDCALDDGTWANVWEQAWRASNIRQKAERLEGSGLSVVDQWLDKRIRDQALLLVVACRFQSQAVDGTAEALVGILFGNRLTQSTIRPTAYLHRPEPVDKAAAEPLSSALLQALDWVPLVSSRIAGVWKAGSDADGDRLITQALEQVGLPVSQEAGLHDLDGALGHAGCAAPWLAIAAAVEAIWTGDGPQFICSGDGAEGFWSWCSVVVPPEV